MFPTSQSHQERSSPKKGRDIDIEEVLVRIEKSRARRLQECRCGPLGVSGLPPYICSKHQDLSWRERINHYWNQRRNE